MVQIDVLLNQNMSHHDYSERLQWLLRVCEWLRTEGDHESHSIAIERALSVRLKYLLHLFSRNPDWGVNFANTASSVLQKISSVSLFTTVGMANHHGFLQDFLARLQDKILPQSPLADDLATLMLEIFPDKDQSVLVDGIDESVLSDFLALFANDANLNKSIQESLAYSAYILSSKILSGAFDIYGEVHALNYNPSTGPAAGLHSGIAEILDGRVKSVSSDLYASLDQCEQERQRVYELIESRGIKIDLIYSLETQRRRIERLRGILHLMNVDSRKVLNIRLFVAQLILDIHHQKSLISFFTENLSLLTQRIVQRNSDIGEHYVTFNWHDFKVMFRSALGGGGVTSITVLIKLFVGSGGWTGFLKGLLDSLNYSASFLYIYTQHWTLATKQPSATAPYIAQSLKRSVAESRRAVVALLRTQFIAVVGNLSLVFPISLAISLTAMYLGHPLITAEYAKKAIASTNILGPSPVFAALTGVLLFASSLIAGWFENWSILHQLPERIRNHKTYLRLFGRPRTEKIANFLQKNANGLAANISLGFLMGMSPQVLKFLNFPFDVRHITLATGTFATALPLIWDSGSLSHLDYLNSISGILIIGLLNISVSFAIALLLACISTKVRIWTLWNLLKWGFVLVLTRPWLLLVPEDKIKKP